MPALPLLPVLLLPASGSDECHLPEGAAEQPTRGRPLRAAAAPCLHACAHSRSASRGARSLPYLLRCLLFAALLCLRQPQYREDSASRNRSSQHLRAVLLLRLLPAACSSLERPR